MRRKPKPYIEATLRGMIPLLTKLTCLVRMPYLTFERQEIKRMGMKRYSNLGNRYLGMAWHKENVIYVSPRHANTESAKNTLIHEFTHLRFPYLSHTKKFDEMEKRLARREQLKPYKKATPSQA